MVDGLELVPRFRGKASTARFLTSDDIGDAESQAFTI